MPETTRLTESKLRRAFSVSLHDLYSRKFQDDSAIPTRWFGTVVARQVGRDKV